MADPLLMTFNAGSSSVKIGLFSIHDDGLERIAHALIDFRHSPLTFHLVEGKAIFDVELKADHADHLIDVMTETLDWIAHHYDLSELTCVGHRVVHGGDEFDAPVLIDDDSLARIEALSILAPLHQPQALRLIRAMRHIKPDLVQVASFDTVFHRTNPELIRRFALPRELHDRGIKRYGFHGLSYKFIAGELHRRFPEAAGSRVIAAHLGSGASLCAMRDGKSQDTSMGFSTLDGIPMATRCGALDPGVILHLLQQEHRPVAEVEDMLYHQSGLKGVSGGISADCRELEASDDPRAKEAPGPFHPAHRGRDRPPVNEHWRAGCHRLHRRDRRERCRHPRLGCRAYRLDGAGAVRCGEPAKRRLYFHRCQPRESLCHSDQ